MAVRVGISAQILDDVGVVNATKELTFLLESVQRGSVALGARAVAVALRPGGLVVHLKQGVVEKLGSAGKLVAPRLTDGSISS